MSVTSTGLSDHEFGTALEPTRRVAQRLGVSVRTVQRWIKSGILDEPIKVNGYNYHRAGVMPRRDPGPARKPPAAGRYYAT